MSRLLPKHQYLYNADMNLVISAHESNAYQFESGFSAQAEGDGMSPHRWTISEMAVIKTSLINITSQDSANLILDAIPFTTGAPNSYQDAIISIDGISQGTLRFREAGEKTLKIRIPMMRSHNSAFSFISIYLPNSMSPALLGMSDDQRSLGLGFRKMELNF